jgi:hypothetical protein
MKHFFTFLLAVLLTSTTFAQVGINTETPDPSSALDITSTAGGLLPPRMTSDQRDNIVSPVEGLIIFCTDCGYGEGELQIKLSSQWVNLYNPGAGGGTKYLALLQFNSAEAITSITMVDPISDGTYTTSGVITTTSTGSNGEKFAEFQFINEGYAPSSVVAYAADMRNDIYKITALNTAGDNLAHIITGPTMSNISSNDFQSDLFSSFSSSTFKIDCTIDNLDYVRDNIPPVFKEAHVYIVFQF